MGWTPRALASALQQAPELNVNIDDNEHSFIIIMISRLKNDEYYVAFGALSLNSSLEDVVLEIATLAANALDLAELIEQYTNE